MQHSLHPLWKGWGCLSLVLFLRAGLNSLAVGSDLPLFLVTFAILLPKCLYCFSLTSWWKRSSPLDTVHDFSNPSFLSTLVLVHLAWD